jgi:hypothetical protein
MRARRTLPRPTGSSAQHRHEQPVSARSGFLLRLSVFLTRGRLDRQILGGQPWESPAATALRSRQLIEPRTRQRLARSLRGIVDYVDYADRLARYPQFSAVVIAREPARAGRPALLGLSERLDGPDRISARGIVLAMALLTDGANSPIFNRNSTRTVTEAVWEIADALGADEPPTIEFRHVTHR